VPVDQKRRVRLLAGQHVAQRRQQRRQLRAAQVTLGVGRCEAAASSSSLRDRIKRVLGFIDKAPAA